MTTPGRRGDIPPFLVMEVMRAAAAREVAGDDVFHLEVGQPSTAAPRAVLDAAKAALEDDVLGYTLALGVTELRQAIAEHYQSFYGVAVPADRIVVTTGASGAFLLAFLAAFEAGDRVALALPGYPGYRHILSALGNQPVSMAAGPATRFQPTVAMIEGLDEAVQGLIVASPSNPAGTIIPEAELARLAGYCDDHRIRLVSDEIYHGITYGTDAATAVAYSDQAIVINSFSKYFSMTGWRLGWMVVPESLMRAVESLAQNMFISPPTLSQRAALAAFDCGDEIAANIARYSRNRALLLEELPKAGFTALAPADGAFYIYADVSHMTNDSQTFCQRMLDETGVAATSGVDFDPERGNAFVRFSFSGSTEDMAEAARRLRDWQR
ncbi:MAG: aminotransferase class I/II-fold pyridoxal phosphate-dependent enzyme [Alphaproteobacteria bacterium]|jgi:aspartate/methionine/tyrosine aminotransferase